MNIYIHPSNVQEGQDAIHCRVCKLDVLDMAVPLVQEFTALENEGIIAYDAFLQRNVIVVAPILNIICDNPRGAEVCSHLGATTSKYCRICMVSYVGVL